MTARRRGDRLPPSRTVRLDAGRPRRRGQRMPAYLWLGMLSYLVTLECADGDQGPIQTVRRRTRVRSASRMTLTTKPTEPSTV